MAERRSSRTRKRVDYVKLSVDEDSDDDFAGCSPPSGPPQKKRNSEVRTRSTNSQDKAGKESVVPPLRITSCKETIGEPFPLAKGKGLEAIDLLPSSGVNEEVQPKVVVSPLQPASVDVRGPSTDSNSCRPIRRKTEPKLTVSSSEDKTDEDEVTTENTTSESEEDTKIAKVTLVKSTMSESPKSKKNNKPDSPKVLVKPGLVASRTPLHNILIKGEPQRLSSSRKASSGSAGLRLGLNRNARVKSLHPAVKVGPH